MVRRTRHRSAGVNIGDGAVIGAGSVVTHSIPARVVAAGNPCRVLRPIEKSPVSGRSVD